MRTAAELKPVVSPKRPGLLYLLLRAALRPVVLAIFRPKIQGADLVPKHGPVIFAANHLSFFDSIVIPLAAPRRVQFLAKSHYFTGTGFRGWLSRTFFKAIGAVSVDREPGNQAQAALKIGQQILDQGGAFALYPEGTRSLDGRLYRGRTGVAWLALTTGSSVVPVGLRGTADVKPIGGRFPRRRHIAVSFGNPLNLKILGNADSGKARRQATDEIMGAIHSLTGQQLAGVYNEIPANDVRASPIGRATQPDRVVPPDRVT